MEHPGYEIQGRVSYHIVLLEEEEKDIEVLIGCMRDMIGRLTSWPGQSDTPAYIWQRDRMEIRRCSMDNHANTLIKGVVEGCVRFDENVDDEWFVVWILRELSKTFHVAIRVWDTDGEFLLIEAAYSLPDWLEPTVAENRVWLYRGHVHCIPLNSCKEKTCIDSIDQGIQMLLDDPGGSKTCGREIDAVVSRRIREYPEYAQNTMHRATVCVPRSVAAILQDDPQSVSLAAETFINSVSAERNRASNVCRYLREGDTLVPFIVTFNRLTYSNLKLSSYQAPTSSPWHIYSEEYKSRVGTGAIMDDVQAALHFGLHLTLGFELAKVAPGTVNSELERYIARDCSYKDDESWLYEASALLESELDIREQELGGFDPEEFSRRMKGFLSTMSHVDGAVAEEEEVSLDPDVFFKILEGRPVSSEDEGSSFYDMSGESGEESLDGIVLTETDSDDDDGFDAAYDEALAKELKNTCLDTTFGGDDDAPVHVDLHLVSNLLSSHEQQHSNAGPVSTLAGLLGVSLPRHDVTPKGSTSENGTR